MKQVFMRHLVWLILNRSYVRTWGRLRQPLMAHCQRWCESDLRGVLHVHSTWSDGQNTIREMAEACIVRGLTYLGLTDHSKTAAYAGGLNEEDLRRQHEEIDLLNKEYAGRLHILKGIECDILRDGSLDFADDVLATLDFVVASIHSLFNLSPEE